MVQRASEAGSQVVSIEITDIHAYIYICRYAHVKISAGICDGSLCMHWLETFFFDIAFL